MEHQVIHTAQAPAAIGPYSQAVQVGSWLFVSGQIGLRPDTGELAGSNFEHQARQALDNLRCILQSAGYSMGDVVSVDVYLTDMTQFALFNGMYQEYFPAIKPARAVVEVQGLPRGASVEVKCIAHRMGSS
jgi:2-iminobutanoate/2-iminopropanoate deaminase